MWVRPESTRVKHLSGAPIQCRLLTLPTNIRQDRKGWPGTNTVAYNKNSLTTAVKFFNTLTPDGTATDRQEVTIVAGTRPLARWSVFLGWLWKCFRRGGLPASRGWAIDWFGRFGWCWTLSSRGLDRDAVGWTSGDKFMNLFLFVTDAAAWRVCPWQVFLCQSREY